MKLAEFQALFQQRVLAGAGTGDRPLLETLRPSRRGAAPATLLGVYQNGYRARLGAFLTEDHPGLRGFIGEQAFAALVDDYIAANPPRNRNARWYTTGLPDFMRESLVWGKEEGAISMALFERAMVDAFDAAEAPPLTIETLSNFAPNDWPSLVFRFHPSLALTELASGTLDAYEAATSEDAPPPEAGRDGEKISTVETVAVWRLDDRSVFRELEADEFLALSEARAGRAFGDICQEASLRRSGEIEPERLAQFLASWFEDGMIVEVRIEERG